MAAFFLLVIPAVEKILSDTGIVVAKIGSVKNDPDLGLWVEKCAWTSWENEDLETCLSMLDEGFINMFSFGMSMTKEQCRDGFADVFDTYSIEDVEFESVEVIADQNYAFETLLFQQKWITNDKQDTILFDLRSMTVFKKQEDSSWKWFRHIAQQ